MKTKIIQNIKSTILALILVAGVSYVSAVGTWSNPPPGTVPPNNNTETPLNVGITPQIKTGSLTLGGLGILGDLKFLPVSGTPPTAGQILMADDTDLANGKVKWGTATGGTGGSCSATQNDVTSSRTRGTVYQNT